MPERQVEAIKELNALDGRWITLLWISGVASGGGVVRLLLGSPEPLQIVFAGVGLLFVLAAFVAVLIFDRRIRSRTQMLGEKL